MKNETRFDFLAENLRSGGWLTLPLFRIVIPQGENSLFFFILLLLLVGLLLVRLLPQVLLTEVDSFSNPSINHRLRKLSRSLDQVVLFITSLFYFMAGFAGLALVKVILLGIGGVTDYDRLVVSTGLTECMGLLTLFYLFYILLNQFSVLRKVISHLLSALTLGVIVLFIYRGLLFENTTEMVKNFLYPSFNSLNIHQFFIWFSLLTLVVYTSTVTSKRGQNQVFKVEFRSWWSLFLTTLWPLILCLYFIDTRWSLNLLGDPLLDLGRYLLPLWLGPLLIMGLAFVLITLSLNGLISVYLKIMSQFVVKTKWGRMGKFFIPVICSLSAYGLFKIFRTPVFAETLVLSAAICIWIRLALRLKSPVDRKVMLRS